MLSLRNLLKVLASTMVPLVLLIGVVGWAERARPFAGGNAPAVATPTLAAYPLPGQSPGPAAPRQTSTPTRLPAYPLPGAPPPPLSIATATLTPVV